MLYISADKYLIFEPICYESCKTKFHEERRADLSLKKTEALVIRDTDYRETSKIFEVFTPAHGTMRLLAKGIKRPAQRTASLLQPFAHARLTYYQRELATMGILRESEVVEQFTYLRGDLVRLSLAYVFVELLAKSSGQRNEAIFRLALRFLRDLKSASRPVDFAICFFYRLLTFLGYRPSLERCGRCGAATGLVAFDIARGGALCGACLRQLNEGAMELDLGTLKTLQRCLSLPLAKLSSVRFSQRQKELLLALFWELVRHHLETDIKSARFLQQVLPARAGGNSTERPLGQAGRRKN
jgi:DNA repair protein RecO (recombination protein O)